MTRLVRSDVVAMVAVLGLALAGCSSGRSGRAGPTTVSTTSAPAPSSSVTEPGSTSRPATTRAGTAAGCVVGQLALTAGEPGAGLSHYGLPIIFRNTSNTACTLSGYPGVAGLSAGGAQIGQAQRTPSGYLGGLANGGTTPPVVVLAPGQSGSALLETTAVAGSGTQPCPTFAGLLVTSPNETHSVRLVVNLPGCPGFQVHPVVAGTTGSQG
jgi:hypothetical protein